MQATKIHARELSALPINAQIAIAVVSDPYSRFGEKITVTRSIRDDLLAGMQARSQIDEAQFMAGRHYQRAFEACEIGGIQAVDTMKEPVDGGKLRDPITDRQVKAFKDISEAHRALGPDGAKMVAFILTQHVGVRAFSESRGRMTQYGWKKTGQELRGHLETLAVLYGYAMKDKRGACLSTANHP